MDLYEHLMWDGIGGGSGNPFDSPFIPLAAESVVRSSSMTIMGIPIIAATVDTEAFFPMNSPASIDVEMDGVLYKNVEQKYFPPLEGEYYGATFSGSGFDWSEYPFAMFFDFEEDNIICATESPKEFRIKVGTADTSVFIGGVTKQITVNGYYKIKGYSSVLVAVT